MVMRAKPKMRTVIFSITGQTSDGEMILICALLRVSLFERMSALIHPILFLPTKIRLFSPVSLCGGEAESEV